MKSAAAALALGVCARLVCNSVSAGEETLQLLEGAGRDLTASACSTCHSLDYIQMNGPIMNRAAWEKTVRKMVEKFGAPVRPEDVEQILAYLSTHYSG